MIASIEAKEHEGISSQALSSQALAAAEAAARTVETDVPVRLDRLGWGRFHTLVVAALGIVLLNPAVIDPELAWRVAFLAGAVLGLGFFLMRFWIPESPCWLTIHGRPNHAHAIIAGIERGAPPAASAAYVTVSKTFPLEIRALAIATLYAVGIGVGGVAGPALFGVLIDTGPRASVFGGYLPGAALMIAAAVLAWWLCIASERKPLEHVARPLAAVE